jgi:SAM-dependent methyltransferase
VVGADISEPLLALARRRAAEADATGCSFMSADVQTDPVEGSPFDVALSQFGVMFFEDPVAAFTNIAGLLRPGGRLGFACWQSLDRNPWFVGPVLAPFVPAPLPAGPGTSPTGPFTLADPDRVTTILTAAGFADVDGVDHELVVEAAGLAVIDEAQLRFMGVPEAEMEGARAVVEVHLARFGEPRGLCRFPLAFQIFTALRPAGPGAGRSPR